MAANALKKINARVKVLQKKHPNHKRKTLQKQAGKEYREGKLSGAVGKKKKKAKGQMKLEYKIFKRKSPAKPWKRIAGKKKRKPAKRAKSVTLGSLVRRKRRKSTPKKQTRRRSIGRKSELPLILGIAAVGVLGYMLLKPKTPVLTQTTNTVRNTQATGIVQYATALGLGAAAIAQLINALNNSSDDQVSAAANNPASVVAPLQNQQLPTSTITPPTGGPSLFQI